MKEIKVKDLDCVISGYPEGNRAVYMIYPAIVPLDKEWIKDMSEKYKVTIVVIYIPAYGWNDMLTPWPEAGETPKSPSFAGDAAETLRIIREEVIPQTDATLGNIKIEERDLIGVSLSGLFTFWEWLQCDVFQSIGCLSGSFWYPGFIEWFEKQTIPAKKGKAYFLLGVKEPKAWVKAYRSVGRNTEIIVNRLKASGINTTFEWVPGNHTSHPLERAEDALKNLYLKP